MFPPAIFTHAGPLFKEGQLIILKHDMSLFYDEATKIYRRQRTWMLPVGTPAIVIKEEAYVPLNYKRTHRGLHIWYLDSGKYYEGWILFDPRTVLESMHVHLEFEGKPGKDDNG